MPPTSKDLKRALARIRSVLPESKKLGRNIRLGLERIRHIVPVRQDWIGIHVGGTNGKGSICTLLAGMLRRAGMSHGVFISPAMPEPYNGVLINGRYANSRMYEIEAEGARAAYRRVASGWTFSKAEGDDELTPFELQTATAFRVFDKMHVKYGIVEVGMGGATDATNAMREKAVTVISRIGLDHQEYLGGTIEEIAKVKAGIMRQSVPCIVDHTNPDSVLRVLSERARVVGTQITLSSKAEPLLADLDRDRFRLEPYEEQNLKCAVLAFQKLFPNLKLDVNKLIPTEPFLPGRKEIIKVTGLTGGLPSRPILVDGAHNMLGVETLAAHVNGGGVRRGDEPVTWVMAMSSSKTKPFGNIIETLLQPQDNLAFVEYTAQDGDPPPAPADLGRDIARTLLRDSSRQLYDGRPSISAGVKWACAKAEGGPIVVTGSLYMIRDLYKLEGVEPQRKIGMMRPGPSQLWHYTRLAQERALTSDEKSEFKRARRHGYLSPRRSPVFRNVGDGGKPESEEVPEEVSIAQRAAAYHKKQAEGYKAAIASILKDKKGAMTDSLDSAIKALQSKQHEHLHAYNKAMVRVRGHLPDPNMKFASYERIFVKQQKKRKRPVTSILHKHGLLFRLGQAPTPEPQLEPERKPILDLEQEHRAREWRMRKIGAEEKAERRRMKETDLTPDITPSPLNDSYTSKKWKAPLRSLKESEMEARDRKERTAKTERRAQKREGD
ncbi:hypothetical protein XA68_12897 [Ophiocordyceps unilateralis]|uniref:Mur ligase central domain-containing protein n=1 Tax=Ophiocordyceps unilateralis TaxID=268505 RepID=A0A2A9PCM0_OPHUN|nr:hypothetical protein XA68_12897 [Ophiocordyceps unilateralis]